MHQVGKTSIHAEKRTRHKRLRQYKRQIRNRSGLVLSFRLLRDDRLPIMCTTELQHSPGLRSLWYFKYFVYIVHHSHMVVWRRPRCTFNWSEQHLCMSGFQDSPLTASTSRSWIMDNFSWPEERQRGAVTTALPGMRLRHVSLTTVKLTFVNHFLWKWTGFYEELCFGERLSLRSEFHQMCSINKMLPTWQKNVLLFFWIKILFFKIIVIISAWQ